jgi:hypothetical protein
MSAGIQIQSYGDVKQSDGSIWYQLRSEREEICEAMVPGLQTPEQGGVVPSEMDLSKQALDANQLQERLRLIDNALDRLMAGT